MKIEERIEVVQIEINEFEKALAERQGTIQKLQQESNEITQGILTRQGGLIELRKLIEEEK